MQDSLKIKDYVEKIKEAHFKSQEREKMLCEELLSYSREHQNAYGIGFAYTYLLDYYIIMHDTEGGALILKEALEFHSGHEFLDLRMQVFNFAGIYSSYVHDDITALEYFLKSLELAEKLDDEFMRYRLYNNIAVSFHNKKDYAAALPYYQKAYEHLGYSQVKGLYIQYQLYLQQNIINCSITMDARELVEEYCGKMKQLMEDYPELQEDMSIPWQKAIILAYYGKTQEAYEILCKNLCWEENDPLDVTDIIELYPHILELLLAWKEKKLAWKVLKSLSYYMERESPRAMQEACAYEIRFYQIFEMKEELQRAYERYYQASKEASVSISSNQIRAMKEKIKSFEVQQKLNRLQRLSYMDGLCELYNRRYYTEQLERVMGDDTVKMLGIIILDIDHFKEYNDFYGHNSGDVVLKNVALCIREGADDRIIPCRYGGDEFTCICSDMTAEEIESYLAGVHRRLRDHSIAHIKSATASIVTVSAGYSVREKRGLDLQSLFHEADEALYLAKSAGKDRDCGYQRDGKEGQ